MRRVTVARSSFRKSNKQREQYKRFLIVSEGAVTEEQYLNGVKRSRRVRSGDMEFFPPGPTSPVEIVKRARDLQNKARASGDKYDFVWCIFDVESGVDQRARPRLSEAINMANACNVSVALSNPCFELWILLHRQVQEASIDRHRVQRLCSSLALVVGKHIQNVEQILDNYPTAREHARALEDKHDREGRREAQDRNPSSRVFELVEAIYAAFPLPT
jgi:hypothetical protein